MTPLQVKKTFFHLKEKWRIFFGYSVHLLGEILPRIQLLFRLSRCLAIFIGLNCIFEAKLLSQEKNIKEKVLFSDHIVSSSKY